MMSSFVVPGCKFLTETVKHADIMTTLSNYRTAEGYDFGLIFQEAKLQDLALQHPVEASRHCRCYARIVFAKPNWNVDGTVDAEVAEPASSRSLT
jgi:hypothetical protein